MEDYTRRYLRYLRASLADGARLAPNPEDGSEVDVSSLMSGKIGPKVTTALFERAKAEKWRDMEDEQLWPLPVLVCPSVYALRPEHGRGSTRLPRRIVPVVLAARLHEDGSLEAGENGLPLIPRNYLEPSPSDVVIGTLEEADQAYATLEMTHRGWDALVARSHELIAKVTNRALDDLVLEQYEKLPYGVCLLHTVPGKVIYIERLLDVMLKDAGSTYPVLDSLLSCAEDLPVKSAAESLRASALHLGQMECNYPLSSTQREALVHHLERPAEAPDILAIDGPPGTGKTTLLLSVIATSWVQRALDEADAPLIVATSTNNQAVENIIEACRKIKEPKDVLSGRWITGIRGYGQLLPSNSRVAGGKTKDYHVCTHTPSGVQHAAQGCENPEGLRRARTEYLERFCAAFPQQERPDLESAKLLLHRQLQQTVARIRCAVDALSTLGTFVDLANLSRASCEERAAQFAIQLHELSGQLQLAQDRLRGGKVLRKDWKEHLSGEPLWFTLLAALGFESPRRRRDELFSAKAAIQHEELLGDQLGKTRDRADFEQLIEATLVTLAAQANTAAAALQEASSRAQSFASAHTELKGWYDNGRDGSIAAIQGALDLGPRYRAFKLATHYWEARYLLEVEKQLAQAGTMDDSRSPVKLQRLFRRLAKLFPYSVSTTYTLPGRFTGWRGEDEPLFGVIDLLIVDEAGQIPLEVGMFPFALARRAVVVGDVDQLHPMWAIPGKLDAKNALRFGIIQAPADEQAFPEGPLAVSGSSLMRVAQRATPFNPYPQRGRGMLLREHRRCWPEIINICNALAYRGLLIPKREGEDRKFVPSIGYVHIPGTDRYQGKSRYNLAEARAIARWLVHGRERIETAFNDDESSDEKKTLGQLVAVVTPFVAQARAIRASLDSELGEGHGITVGTVDALQGAEYRVVLFSPTYGVSTRPGNTRFDRDPSFLNVAISRAQDSFLIFGNMHLFKPQGAHPSAVVGRFLFSGGQNELQDIPVELLVPGEGMPAGRLIHNLDGHRAVLTDALENARFRLVIVSPFLRSAAIAADDIAAKIRRARKRHVSVTIVSDAVFNSDRYEFEQCAQALIEAGAEVRAADGPSVHSKLILVDQSWLVVGSFNWLSTPRHPHSRYVRHEASIRYDGNEAFEMIRESLKDLAAFVPRQ